MKRGAEELVTLEGIKRRESDKAVLVVVEDTGEEVWFPLSQVDSMHFDGKGHGKIVVTAWIARQKGLA